MSAIRVSIPNECDRSEDVLVYAHPDGSWGTPEGMEIVRLTGDQHAELCEGTELHQLEDEITADQVVLAIELRDPDPVDAAEAREFAVSHNEAEQAEREYQGEGR